MFTHDHERVEVCWGTDNPGTLVDCTSWWTGQRAHY